MACFRPADSIYDKVQVEQEEQPDQIVRTVFGISGTQKFKNMSLPLSTS